MAALCSIITKEVRDSYESFMKNEGITNRNNFNIAIYNSIMTSLLVANENMRMVRMLYAKEISLI